MIDRLLFTLLSQGVRADRITGTPPSVTIVYRSDATANDTALGSSILASFDWSQSADDAWRLQRRRDQSAAMLDLTSADLTLLRGLLQVLVDEINLLRQSSWLLVGTATFSWDPPSMANGTGATSSNIAVAGAAFGDVVDVAAPYSLAGLVATGYVAASGQVNVRLHNGTGAAINPVVGNWIVWVRRSGAMANRTLAQAKSAVANAIQAGKAD